MSDPAITERQQFWLENFQAAEDFDGSLAEYAHSAGLKSKELYQWKTMLVRRGLLTRPGRNPIAHIALLREPGIPVRCKGAKKQPPLQRSVVCFLAINSAKAPSSLP